MAPPRLYFDWNSTTPPLPGAIEAMVDVYRSSWGNPSSVHAEGRRALALLERARQEVAELVGARPKDLLFTSGGTEATNLAIRSPFSRDSGGAVVVAAVEHASVLAVAAVLERGGVEVRRPRVLPTGEVDIEDVARHLAQGGVRLLAIQVVNGETGVVQPFETIAALAHRHGAVVHLDAVQALGRMVPPTGGWLAHGDTLSLAAHKMRGPKGVGALARRAGHPLTPVLVGATQEHSVRPGTQDAALAQGFAVAARAAQHSHADYEALTAARAMLENGVRALGGAINGEGALRRAPHVTHASFPRWTSPELVAALDLEGLAASGGSACHAGIPAPSSTLAAMWGAESSEQWRLLAPVRFSLPPGTTAQDVERALGILRRVFSRVATTST